MESAFCAITVPKPKNRHTDNRTKKRILFFISSQFTKKASIKRHNDKNESKSAVFALFPSGTKIAIASTGKLPHHTTRRKDENSF